MKNLIKLFIHLLIKIYLIIIWVSNILLPTRLVVMFRNQAQYIKLINSYGNLDPGYKKINIPIVRITIPILNEQVHPNEFELISKITESFLEAKKKQINVSKPYKPGEYWGKILEIGWREYLDAINRQNIDAMSLLLRNFFRNEGITGFWGNKNMYINFCKPLNLRALTRADLMMKQYEVWKNLCPTISLTDLEAPRIGNPWGYSINGVLLYEPVFEYHFQAHFFFQLLSSIDYPVIIEVGGGFGGLAYFIRKLNPSVKYIGFDLPENIFLQTYYLSCAFPKARILMYNNSFTKLDKKTLNSYDIVLLPNFELPNVESSIADLIVNVRSLSEMPLETIASYFKEFDRIGRLFFFHENIFKSPSDEDFYGFPSSLFPILNNFQLCFAFESRWPRYQKESNYPCQENLFIHKALFNNPLSNI